MEILQGAFVVAATVLLVLVFCSGIKAVCRRILSKTEGEELDK